MKHVQSDIVVFEYLSNRYPNIVYSMLCDEFYILQDKRYDFFYEVTYFGSVVGFVSGDFVDGYLVCDLCYILPSFRSMGLFCDAIKTINNLFDIGVCLNLPNSYAVHSLINNKCAFKLNGHLVMSGFPLSFTDYSEDELVFSRLYDLNTKGVVHLDRNLISPLLDVDAENTTRNITDNYFRNIENELIHSISWR